MNRRYLLGGLGVVAFVPSRLASAVNVKPPPSGEPRIFTEIYYEKVLIEVVVESLEQFLNADGKHNPALEIARIAKEKGKDPEKINLVHYPWRLEPEEPRGTPVSPDPNNLRGDDGQTVKT